MKPGRDTVSLAHLYPAFLVLYTLMLTLVSTLEERQLRKGQVMAAAAALMRRHANHARFPNANRTSPAIFQSCSPPPCSTA